MKDQITAFLSKHILCTIATVTPDAKPEAAYVGFRHNKDLELLIGTSRLSRKYQNLQQNPHVAFVMADLEGEVQYEGIAEEISLGSYDELIAATVFEALPGIEKYRSDPNQIFFRIKPTWLRFIQHGENDQITEMTEF